MTENISALSMAAVAYSFVSIGIVLQKKGIFWIGWKGLKDKTYYKHLAVWLSGFLLMNLYGIPSAIALKSLPPHQVSAFAGWGVIVLVFLSKFFLKDVLFRSDYFYSLVVIAGIVMLNLSGNPVAGSEISLTVLTLLYFFFPVFLFILSLLTKFNNKIVNVLTAVVSGCTAGLMVISLKGLIGLHGYRITEYPASIYFYLYLFFALISFLSLQMSLKTGPVLITGQLQYSSTIIYPVAGSLIVFSGKTGLFQIISIVIIVIGVIRILKNR
ncbi:MAG: hypothetical protein ABFR36_07805 [Acidobacteriota bacterium]